ncbi:MAG: tRNA (cytidine(34)-2'-O)-methyltransferase [Magnetococcus sp. THC-1_WYH]
MHFLDSTGAETVKQPKGLFHIVLYQPEIPPNTGTIIRLCAAAACPLHLIGPLGFRLDASGLRRAGMDYRDMAQTCRWRDWDHYLEAYPAAERRIVVSTKGNVSYDQWSYRAGDHLLFGSEGGGLPADIMHQHRANLVRIPMAQGCRSLNLAISTGIVLYEALRQNRFVGLDTGAGRKVP